MGPVTKCTRALAILSALSDLFRLLLRRYSNRVLVPGPLCQSSGCASMRRRCDADVM
jgi:hypothetical protein